MKYAVVSVGADLSGNLTEDGDDYGADMDVRLSELGGARYACHETINVGTTTIAPNLHLRCTHPGQAPCQGRSSRSCRDTYSLHCVHR